MVHPFFLILNDISYDDEEQKPSEDSTKIDDHVCDGHSSTWHETLNSLIQEWHKTDEIEWETTI